MKRILIVEGNLREENQSFTDGGIKTHTESLKDSISYFTDQLDIDVVNPSSDENINEVAKDFIGEENRLAFVCEIDSNFRTEFLIFLYK